MRVTVIVRASHVHKPLINFIGKRTVGAGESHDPQPPKDTPATDFKRYRANAQQHGPLARSGHFPSRQTKDNSEASSDVVFDRDDLPARFRRMVLTPQEIEAIDSGGATLVW